MLPIYIKFVLRFFFLFLSSPTAKNFKNLIVVVPNRTCRAVPNGPNGAKSTKSCLTGLTVPCRAVLCPGQARYYAILSYFIFSLPNWQG